MSQPFAPREQFQPWKHSAGAGPVGSESVTGLSLA